MNDDFDNNSLPNNEEDAMNFPNAVEEGGLDYDNSTHSAKLHESTETLSVDAQRSNPFMEWIGANKVSAIVASVAMAATVIAGGTYIATKPVEQVRFENVVPPRADGSQDNIIKEKTIPGAGRGTITTVDNVQNGKNVSAPWIAVDSTGNPNAATLTVPEDIGTVGWFGRSAPPGVDAGSTVMSSHINYNGVTGYGSVFLTLKEGDPITVTTDDGKEWNYVVDSNTQVTKARNDEEKKHYAEITNNTLNKMDGPNFLVLVTCSGNYDPSSPLGYDQNTIVVAHLVR